MIPITPAIQTTKSVQGCRTSKLKGKPVIENECAMDLDAKQTELEEEEETNFAASFHTTFLRSTKYNKWR